MASRDREKRYTQHHGDDAVIGHRLILVKGQLAVDEREGERCQTTCGETLYGRCDECQSHDDGEQESWIHIAYSDVVDQRT